MGGKKPIGSDPSRGNCRSHRGRRQSPASLVAFNSSDHAKIDIMEKDFSLFSSIWILDPNSSHGDEDDKKNHQSDAIKNSLLFGNNNMLMAGDTDSIDPEEDDNNFIEIGDDLHPKLEFVGTDSYPEYHDDENDDDVGLYNKNIASPREQRRKYVGDGLHLMELTSRVVELTLLVNKLQSTISQMSPTSTSLQTTPVVAELAPIGPPRSLSKSSSAASINLPSSSFSSSLPMMTQTPILPPASPVVVQPHPSSISSDCVVTKMLDRISTLEGRQSFVQSKISQLDVAFGGSNPASWRKATKKLQNIIMSSSSGDECTTSAGNSYYENGGDASTTNNTNTNTNANSHIAAESQSVEYTECSEHKNDLHSTTKVSSELASSLSEAEEDKSNANVNAREESNGKKTKKKKHQISAASTVTPEDPHADSISHVSTPVPVSHSPPTSTNSISTRTTTSVVATQPTTSVSPVHNQAHYQGQMSTAQTAVTTLPTVSSNLVPSPNRSRVRDHTPWNGSNSVRRWHRHDQDFTGNGNGNGNGNTGSAYNYMYMSPSQICYYYPLPQYAATGVPTNQYPYPSYPYVYSIAPGYQQQLPSQQQQQQSQENDTSNASQNNDDSNS